MLFRSHNLNSCDGNIKVIFQKDYISRDRGRVIYGITEVEVYGYYKPASEFTIKICANNSHNKIINVIFHELTHVKQYCKKELIIAPAGFLWKGIHHSNKPETHQDYLDQPWEVEARRDQEIILSDWKKAHGYHFKQKDGVLYSDNGDL